MKHIVKQKENNAENNARVDKILFMSTKLPQRMIELFM